MQNGENDKSEFEGLDPNINPWTGERYLSREEKDALEKELLQYKSAKAEVHNLRAVGWRTLPEAIKIAQLSRDFINKRMDALSLEEKERFLQTNKYGWTYLHPEFVERLQAYTILPQGNWASAADLSKIFIGDWKRSAKFISEFAQLKTQELMAEGKSQEEVEILVAERYVDLRQSGVKRSYCISPMGIEEAEQKNLIQKKPENILPIRPNWISAPQLFKHYRGDKRTNIAIAEEYVRSKTHELEATGISLSEATVIVKNNYACMCQNGSHHNILALSPLALEELESSGKS